MKHDVDAQYMVPLSRGDQEAFRFLYAKYRVPLTRFSFYFVRSEQVAHDIVQDVFLSVWQARERFRYVRVFHSYIYRAVRNSSINYLKGNIIRQRYAQNTRAATGEWLVEEQYYAQETANVVETLVAKMPEQRHRVYMLSRYSGLKRDQIADKLCLSEKTVANHLHLALQQIRRAIEGM